MLLFRDNTAGFIFFPIRSYEISVGKGQETRVMKYVLQHHQVVIGLHVVLQHKHNTVCVCVYVMTCVS